MMSVRHRPGSFWNDERDIALRRMWLGDEHSAEQIACAIGAASRNAVISRAHRIGLPGKAGKGRGPTNRKGKSPGVHPRTTVARILNGKGFAFGKSPASPTVKLPTLPLPPAAEFDVPRVPTVDLEAHHCRFPCVADVKTIGRNDPIFCGLKVIPGLPYCPGHHARAYTPVRPRTPPAHSNIVSIATRRDQESLKALEEFVA
jgi:GcrA cell cycle regulator